MIIFLNLCEYPKNHWIANFILIFSIFLTLVIVITHSLLWNSHTFSGSSSLEAYTLYLYSSTNMYISNSYQVWHTWLCTLKPFGCWFLLGTTLWIVVLIHLSCYSHTILLHNLIVVRVFLVLFLLKCLLLRKDLCHLIFFWSGQHKDVKYDSVGHEFWSPGYFDFGIIF